MSHPTGPDGSRIGPRPYSRRRRLFIRPADQFRTSLVPTLGAAVLLVAFLAFFHGLNASRTRELADANPAFRDVLEANAQWLETTLAFGAILYLLGVLCVGLVHSRRLMGALFAMNRRIGRLAHGDLLGELRLRRADYFHDVAEGLNGAIRAIRRQAEEDLADVDDLVSVLDRSPHAGPFRDGLSGTLRQMRARKRALLGLESAAAEPEREPAGTAR